MAKKKKPIKTKKVKKIKKSAAKVKIKKIKPKAVKSKKPAQKKGTRAVKPVGKVTHFFGHINVAIVKFNQKISTGAELYFKGATTDFKEVIKSMQYNHAVIAVAPKGKQIGIKVKKRVREGDLVYKAG